MIKQLIAAVLISGLISSGCKTIAVKKYGMGKSFRFESRNEFITFLKKRKIISPEMVLYPDSTGFATFINDKLQKDSSFIYIGTYLNDTTMLVNSQHLSENKSCKGRIKGEIAAALDAEQISEEKKQISTGMTSYHLKHLMTGAKFEKNEMAGKKTVFLVYSYSLGSYYDDLYIESAAMVNSHSDNAELKIICIDPVYLLK